MIWAKNNVQKTKTTENTNKKRKSIREKNFRTIKEHKNYPQQLCQFVL